MREPRAAAFKLPGERRRAALSLAPLIDVTLILLIFFMAVTQMARFAPATAVFGGEQGASIAETGDETASGAVGLLTVTVRADGHWSAGDRDGVDLTELANLLRDRIAKIGVPGSAAPLVSIAPDPETPLYILIGVMNAVERSASVKTRIIMPKLAEGAERQ